MTGRWFWVDGRFAWPFVVAVAIVTALVMMFDFGWRVLIMPFESYLILYVVIVAVAIALAAAWLLYRRRAKRQPRRPGA